MPVTKTIDPDRLRALASDPANKVKDICAGLGIADPTMYQQFAKHPELKQIFTEARAAAKAARNGATATRKPLPPPRKGRAAKQIDSDLARKLLVEFELIDLYGETTERFDDLKEQLRKLA